jgi:hypothetical protein
MRTLVVVEKPDRAIAVAQSLGYLLLYPERLLRIVPDVR